MAFATARLMALRSALLIISLPPIRRPSMSWRAMWGGGRRRAPEKCVRDGCPTAATAKLSRRESPSLVVGEGDMRLSFGLRGDLSEFAKRRLVRSHPGGFLARTGHDETRFHDCRSVGLLDPDDEFALRLP